MISTFLAGLPSGLFHSEIQQHGRMANTIVTGQESSVSAQTERQRSRGWPGEQRGQVHKGESSWQRNKQGRTGLGSQHP